MIDFLNHLILKPFVNLIQTEKDSATLQRFIADDEGNIVGKACLSGEACQINTHKNC